MSSEQKLHSRIAWVDIARGIGIFLVVMGHIYRSNPVLIWICSFHMPLFFILSGWLRGNEKKQIDWISLDFFFKRKCESFIVPLLIFLPIMFVYWLLVERHFRNFEIGPMWFLPVLFFSEVVAEFIIDRTSKNFVRGGVFLTGILLYICSLFINSSTCIAWIPRCLGALTFYLIGVLMSEVVTIKRAKEILSRSMLFSIIGITAVLSVLISQINGRVGLYSLLFGNIVLYLIAAIVGSYLIYAVAILIGKCKPLEFLGRYSIIILCTHEQVKRVLIQIASMITKIPSEEIRNDIICGICISVLIILNRSSGSEFGYPYRKNF